MATVERIRPAGRFAGTARVPGDKSIAHRALMLGAIASSSHRITGLPDADDVASTARCLVALGAVIDPIDGGVEVQPIRTPTGDATLDAGNSGTTARLLAGLACGLGASATIDGDASLRRRPMRRVAEPLRRMGAHIETSAAGTLPLRLRPSPLAGVEYELPVASAQVKSAVLLAGLFAEGATTVIEPVPTRDHTERMLEAMGVSVERTAAAVRLAGGTRPAGIDVRIPGDVSSAAFVLAAGVATGGGVSVTGVGVNPTRTGFLDTLVEMGAAVRSDRERRWGAEPVADLHAGGAALRAVVVEDPARIVSMIDELPLLAVMATRAAGDTVVRGAGELRHKESDRIDAIVRNLRAMGANVDELDDGFVVHGPCALTGTGVDALGDHRIAMAMAVAGLIAQGETTIAGAEAVRISWPGFFDELRRLAGVEENT